MTSWSDDHTFGGRTTVRDVLFDAEHRLAAVGVPSPGFDAAEIVAHVLGTTRTRMLLQDSPTADQRVRIEKLLVRRLSRVPLQHLLGTAPFRRTSVAVGPGVFIPRPETELVAEAAIRELADRPESERFAVDLCSGSGVIAISLATEVPGSRVAAVELSEDALPWTRSNVDAHAATITAMGSHIEVIEGDATRVALPGQPLARRAGTAAAVVANPPYVPAQAVPREPEVRDHEPAMALYGGDDGLDVVRGIVRVAAILLRPGGLLVIEHADVQGVDAGAAGVPGVISGAIADEYLATLANTPVGRALFTGVTDRIDLNGLPRFTLARRSDG
jgi:release factor glutamine methyltransferase